MKILHTHSSQKKERKEQERKGRRMINYYMGLEHGASYSIDFLLSCTLYRVYTPYVDNDQKGVVLRMRVTPNIITIGGNKCGWALLSFLL